MPEPQAEFDTLAVLGILFSSPMLSTTTPGFRTRFKTTTAPKGLLEKIQKVKAPERLPYGFFDDLVTPTRQLLDKGFTLPQAGFFLVDEGYLKKRNFAAYCESMRRRLSRLQQQKTVSADTAYAWKNSLFYDSSHMTASDAEKALCGARSRTWVVETNELHRCARCVGISRRLGLVPEISGTSSVIQRGIPCADSNRK